MRTCVAPSTRTSPSRRSSISSAAKVSAPIVRTARTKSSMASPRWTRCCKRVDMIEMVISVACLLLILYMGRTGAGFGLFFEMTSTLLVAFALLVTLRYWYQCTQFITSIVPVSGAYACFVAYWVMFLIGCIPLLVVMKLVNEDSRPKYPGFLDG